MLDWLCSSSPFCSLDTIFSSSIYNSIFRCWIDYARHLLSVHWTLSLAHRYIILFLGAGLATVVISFLFTTYYNVIITWAFYYLFNTFTSVLPWSFCDPEWASPNCWDGTGNSTTVWRNVTEGNTTILKNFTEVLRPNNSISVTEDFYE